MGEVSQGMEQALVARFVEEAKATAAEVYLASDRRSAASVVVELLYRQGARRVAFGPLPPTVEAELAEVLKREGIEVLHDHLAACLNEIEVVIAMADMAVAENGTLVVYLGDPERRLVTLASPGSIFLLDPADLKETLEMALEAVGERWLQGASFVSFIGGPSRTADIERSLTRGVHGPGIVQVVLAPLAQDS